MTRFLLISAVLMLAWSVWLPWDNIAGAEYDCEGRRPRAEHGKSTKGIRVDVVYIVNTFTTLNQALKACGRLVPEGYDVTVHKIAPNGRVIQPPLAEQGGDTDTCKVEFHCYSIPYTIQ